MDSGNSLWYIENMTEKKTSSGSILSHSEGAPLNFAEARGQLVRFYYRTIESFIRPLMSTGVSPNTITFLALAASLAAAYYYSLGFFFMGGIFLLVAGLLDTVDGSVARLTGRTSKFGALLDSTLDRYAEFFVFFGLLIHFQSSPVFYIVLLALMGSIMVSYIKARSQSLGNTRSVGLMQRPERFILLITGSLFNGVSAVNFPSHPDIIFISTLVILAVLANLTAFRRLREGFKELRDSSS